MSKIINVLNEAMIDIFYDIIDFEEKICTEGEFNDLSITEVHTIDAIGIEEYKKMSEIAKSLNITVGTLTVAINRLVKKGYVERVKIKEDRRVVQIALTEIGKSVYKRHKDFHDNIIKVMTQDLEENEEEVLVKSLRSLNNKLKLSYSSSEN